ncbi:DUF1648 domain-containing protein [Saccharopolyspora rectivirgula]|jgi:uncharacterized membrane protein|uniref:DUF1648 domain-containing protein n=1 Tax=Saccharopolyspora rectivirgula TaxID=28042 RepID=UPI00041FE6E1|nr:DUF1648 domain-containing protein [Saccharopolyspora rectivirgula]
MPTEPPPRFPWLWLVPSLVLLVAMGAWGAVRYPQLPELIPQHIGLGGVDAWTSKSIGSAFLPVFLHLGLTVLFAGIAFGVVRTAPEEELPSDRPPSAIKRPATRASAARLAKAVLACTAGLGVGLLPLCAVQWRTAPSPETPWWLLPLVLVCFFGALVPLFVAAQRDRVEKRVRATREPHGQPRDRS